MDGANIAYNTYLYHQNYITSNRYAYRTIGSTSSMAFTLGSATAIGGAYGGLLGAGGGAIIGFYFIAGEMSYDLMKSIYIQWDYEFYNAVRIPGKLEEGFTGIPASIINGSFMGTNLYY